VISPDKMHKMDLKQHIAEGNNDSLEIIIGIDGSNLSIEIPAFTQCPVPLSGSYQPEMAKHFKTPRGAISLNLPSAHRSGLRSLS
jgi:hypothetical protein